MLGVDTNVLVRFFTADDETQFAQAKALIAGEKDGVFVDPLVLVELNWVLRRVYKLPRHDVLSMVAGMLESREFVIGDHDLVASALVDTVETGCDFADALIARLHERAGCLVTVTFDSRAQRLTRMISVEEVLE